MPQSENSAIDLENLVRGDLERRVGVSVMNETDFAKEPPKGLIHPDVSLSTEDVARIFNVPQHLITNCDLVSPTKQRIDKQVLFFRISLLAAVKYGMQRRNKGTRRNPLKFKDIAKRLK